MTAHGLMTRRMLLRDMGKAGLAVMVLGTSACTRVSILETTTSSSGSGASTTSGSSTSAPGATSTTPVAPTTTAGQSAGHHWHRVNLDFVSAYLLYRDGEAVLVDTGVEGSSSAIEAALGEIGLGWDAVGHVVVTHEHGDHQGSLAEVLAINDAPWYAGEGDVNAISAPTAGSVVGDGDSVFGLDIIETPGHTPGHICVHDPVAGILVAGDALTGTGGAVAGPNPDFTPDMELANASVAKLATFDYEVALFGHGEPVESGASMMVAELASG